MAKYIDAECLRKEVKRLEKAAHKSALGCADSETRKFHEGKDFAYQHVGILIDSLQQEQPSEDLEGEIDAWYNTKGIPVSPDALKDTARHFYELGKQSKEPVNEDLEAEIKRYRKEEMPVVLESDLNDIARHFANWQKEQMMEWARIEENKCISNSSWQRFNALQDVIDKLNEM